MADDIKKLREDFKRFIEAVGPAIYTLPVRARVLRQNNDDYTIDVEVMGADGAPDENWPVLERIEISKLMCSTDGNSGAYFAKESNCLVRVGFYEGDRSRPYLDAVIGATEEGDNPDLDGIYWMIKTRNTRIGVHNDRRIFIESEDENANITINLAGTKLIVADGSFKLGDGATKEAARKGDATTSTVTEDTAFWNWLAGFVAIFAAWIAVPNDGGLALQAPLETYLTANPAPVKLDGIIAAGSEKTKIE